MDRFLVDLVHSARRLARAPGFAAIALLTLALGIGANTAIFSILESVVLRPLPYRDADRVVMIWRDADEGGTTWLSAPEARGFGRDGGVFDPLAAYQAAPTTLAGDGEPERVQAALATTDLFRALGVEPFRGRAFLPTDAAPDPTVVVISHGLWQRRYGGDPDIVGRSILVGDRPRTVIGVLPPSFRVPLDFAAERPIELWSPTSLDDQRWAGFGNRSFIGVGRLRDGVSAAQATAAMRQLEDRWLREGLITERVRAEPRIAMRAQDVVLGDVRYALFVLLAAVGVILLIACANVANLTLARADTRHREIAIRTALGASRRRIVGQLLSESVVLALVGGLLGAVLAFVATELLVAMHPPGVPRVDEIGINLVVLAVTLLLAIGTGVVFGLAPALELSRPELSHAMKDGGRGGSVSRARQRFRDTLAVVQVALSVMLLIGALLLVRSFAAMQRIDLGFDTSNALTFRVSVPQGRYPTPPDVIALFRSLEERVGRVAGVRAVGATRLLPLTGTIGDWSITIEGRDPAPGENPNGDWQVVTPGYFDAMRVSVVRGRLLSETDRADSPIAVVVNETMAERYWPGKTALGKRFHIGTLNQPWMTIVGIVRPVRHNAVVETPRAEMYVAHAQWQTAGGGTPRNMTVIARTAGDPRQVIDGVRAAVRELDPNIPIADVRSLRQIADDSLARPRFTTTLLMLFAGLALVLATVGIYGVISLLVTRRRQEIGIRMALGARRTTILQMVLQRGATLAGVGLVVGLFGALWLTGALTSMLYGVTRFDTFAFAAAPAVMLVVALLACVVPAARAARTSPMVVLRGSEE